jgi:hypothetical protein
MHADPTRARDEERPLVGCVLFLCIPRGAHHQKALQRLALAGRTRLAETVCERVGSQDLELVVVVPGRRYAVIKQSFLHLRLPPGEGLRLGEIKIRADSVPELHPAWFALRVGNQKARSSGLGEKRVITKKTRFDIGAQPYALCEITLRQCRRIREFGPVPIEHMAPVANRGVAGR